jgi:lipase maturation factor 1
MLLLLLLGVSPVSGFIARTKTSLTNIQSNSMLYFPTIFWFDQSDLMLHIVCGVAVMFGVLLSLDIWSGLSSIVCWLLYLSLSIAGQTFTTLPADYLLLESGFLLMFYTTAPMSLSTSSSPMASNKRQTLWRRFATSLTPFNNNPIREHVVPDAITWLLRLLLFRSNFARGVHQILGANDRTWRSLTAFHYLFQSQPSPTWIAWYVRQ